MLTQDVEGMPNALRLIVLDIMVDESTRVDIQMSVDLTKGSFGHFSSFCVIKISKTSKFSRFSMFLQ